MRTGPFLPRDIQITVRIDRELHQALHRTAQSEVLSAQQLMERAIRREIARLEMVRCTPPPLEPEIRMGYLFMLTAPTPMVIKDELGLIVWANLCYQRSLGASLESLRGKALRDIGLKSWESSAIEEDIQEVLKGKVGGSKWCVEPIHIPGRGRVLYGTHRFLFSAEGHNFLGDVSFDWAQISPEMRDVPDDLYEQIGRAFFPPGVSLLFLPFLDSCPTTIAIKDTAGVIRYCNQAYATLAERKKPENLRRTAKELVGRTAKEIWGLSDAHPVVANDSLVATRNRWMYAHETVDEEVGARVSLRFPIPGNNGEVVYLGAISPDFGRHKGTLS